MFSCGCSGRRAGEERGGDGGRLFEREGKVGDYLKDEGC
jgi:hypothetical protein